MLVPAILGSDKMTVSVATGQSICLLGTFEIMFNMLIKMALFMSPCYQFQKVSFPFENITQS